MKVAKVARYELRPGPETIVDAIRYNVKNKYEICEFFKGQKFSSTFHEDGMISILVHDGSGMDDGILINLDPGDWISRDQAGNYKDYSDILFKERYMVPK